MRALIGFMIIALSVAVAQPARANNTPGEFVSDLGKRVVEVLQRTEGNMDGRKSELKVIFIDSFDVDFIATFVIGRFWHKATDSQKSEFKALLPDYVATIYAALFSGYEGDGFKVLKEREKDGVTLVEGEIQRNNAPNVAAAFSIIKQDGQYLVRNASAEGVSLLVTKRSEFSSVLVREGMDGLIARIRKLLEG